MPDREEILKANKLLGEKIDNLGKQIEGIDDRGNHTRWMVYFLIAGIALWLGIWGYKNTNSRIDDREAYDIAACERGNETRMAQRQQWLDVQAVLNKFGDKGTSKLAANLVANANKNFAPVDCEAAKKGEIQVPVTTSTSGAKP